ncbi:unnamed protein product, partial [Mesorhabditis belari]|uniref:TLDc domain-containing protein n=1 Tax=Mesorhabditis belari TaxID=2138241 RepID=A0AAF3E8V4_9BILA
MLLCCRVRRSPKACAVDVDEEGPYLPAVSFIMRRLPSQLFDESFRSTILHDEQSAYLMKNLPSRYQFTTPQLLYRLTDDGISFSRFWARVEDAEQSIMVIRTIDGEIFGAYCSSSWIERKDSNERKKRKYFGTGESYVFRLENTNSSGLPLIYNWAGHAIKNAPEFFMTATDKSLIVGSGNGDAIRIVDELTMGSSAHCATFNSPPLVDGGQFEIEEEPTEATNKPIEGRKGSQLVDRTLTHAYIHELTLNCSGWLLILLFLATCGGISER